MTFVIRSLVVACLATLVGITLITSQDIVCPKPRYKMIGNSPDGRQIVVFDSCLGMVYVTPVIGAPPAVQKQKDIEV